ncbi:unnamed protein product [Leptidea sinapis]|uniref:Uncharacterized protein n=1 Tax=Leptidea sinapis TaxID=189913 RepID=A0A5E4R5A3_9NEOP|nr:unnamed protein product [Leptidea sinapis]
MEFDQFIKVEFEDTDQNIPVSRDKDNVSFDEDILKAFESQGLTYKAIADIFAKGFDDAVKSIMPNCIVASDEPNVADDYKNIEINPDDENTKNCKIKKGTNNTAATQVPTTIKSKYKSNDIKNYSNMSKVLLNDNVNSIWKHGDVEEQGNSINNAVLMKSLGHSGKHENNKKQRVVTS